MQWLENEVAVVTGAGSGIGKAVVHRFVEEGAKVVAFDLSEGRLKALKEALGEIAVVQGDVRRLDDNRKAVATAVSAFGKRSVFVGNAGIHDGRRKLETLSDEELENRLRRGSGGQCQGLPAGGQGSVAGAPQDQGPHGLYSVHFFFLRWWRGALRCFKTRCVGHDAPASQRTGAGYPSEWRRTLGHGDRPHNGRFAGGEK